MANIDLKEIQSMLLFYSGNEQVGSPERVLGDKCHLMLSYAYFKKSKPSSRFKKILAKRKGKNVKRKGGHTV